MTRKKAGKPFLLFDALCVGRRKQRIHTKTSMGASTDQAECPPLEDLNRHPPCSHGGGFNHGSWRELARARIGRLIDRRETIRKSGDLCGPQALLVDAHLKRAREAADSCHGPFKALASWWHGDDVEETWRNIHQAEALLLEFASSDDFRGRLLRTYTYISRHLGDRPEWARYLAGLDNIVRRYSPADTLTFRDDSDRSTGEVGQDIRSFVVTLLRTAQRVDSDGYTRIREYRNVLWVAFLCTGLLAGTLLLAAGRFPQAFPAWLEPSMNRGNFRDAGVIMLYGVLGGAISVLQTLPSLPSFEAPYSLRDPQLLLKVSSGALTAFVGVVLLEADVLPWVKLPQNEPIWQSGKVAAAAIIFGYVQQFITRFVDKEAESIVSAARPYVDDQPSRARADTVRSL